MNVDRIVRSWLGLMIAGSFLLAWNIPPSTTFFNQALATAGWSALAIYVTTRSATMRALCPREYTASGLFLALAALAYFPVWSVSTGKQASSIGLTTVACCISVACAVVAGQTCAAQHRCVGFGDTARGGGGPHAESALWPLVLKCVVAAGLASTAIALVQVFGPEWPDGNWIANSSVAGRAVGNLRQPNHLSSVLLWASIALIGYRDWRRWYVTPQAIGRQSARSALPVSATAVMALLVFAIVLTASRTGLVGVALLALWGLLDRRLSRSSRLLLLATPMMYAFAWWGMAWWAQASDHTFGGQQRLSEGDISGSRFRIWADALQLIGAHPWTGVGWGNFNFAWSLTPFPNRHPAFFDHTHNLPLQLAVELGVPMALLICGLLLWALRQAWQRSLAAQPAASAAGRCAVMMVVLIGLHSLLEYPLWYAYFLLPTAFAWGFALGLPAATQAQAAGIRASPPHAAEGAGASEPSEPRSTEANAGPMRRAVSDNARLQALNPQTETTPEPLARRPGSWPLAAAGALCVAGAVFSVFDYLRVADIFAARPGAAPLEQRIEIGKHSVFFAHHAHYAAATVSDTPGQEMGSFDIASHHLLDTRLMMSWARAFAEVGDLDRARHLAERLREFRNPASADFFAECDRARAAARPLAEWPFQCSPPSRALTWQDFLPQRRAAEAQAQAAMAPAQAPRR